MKTIVLNGDYGFLDKIETTIKSIIYHNQKVKIYVINPDIPHEWFINLNQYLNQIGSQIVDKKIDPGFLQKLHSRYLHINTSAYGRLFIPKLIKEDKVLYLDCDIVVDSKLDDLFDLKFGKNILYAVGDFYGKYEFDSNGFITNLADIVEYNTSVMLINNKKIREENLADEMIKMAEDPNWPNGDQSVINELFKGRIGQLHPSYNYQIGYEAYGYRGNSHILKGLNLIKNPKIIHYITENKPFNMVSVGSLREKWWHYRRLEWSEIISKYGNFDKSKIKDLSFDGEAFLFTHLAETENIEQLIQKLPNIRFNIAAYTPMAFLLLKLIQYDNVRVFPTIMEKDLDREINEADIYLDINYGPKADEIIERIMKRRVPIFSFDQTKSQNLDYNNYHVFPDNQIDEMAEAIKKVVENI